MRRPLRSLFAAAMLLSACLACWTACGDGSKGSPAPAAAGLVRSREIAPSGQLADGGADRGAGHPVVFVGLDGADWDLLDPWLAAGKLPNLARLLAEGRGGVLETQHPPLSPLVWTSMATGRGPLEHRILDFTRFHPQSGMREPITSDERAVPAIWNMAAAAGQSAAVLGLWATFPAEDTGALVVSDRAVQFGVSAPGSVAPASRAADVATVRARAEASVDFPTLAAFVPGLTAVEAKAAAARAPGDAYREPVAALRRILIETRTVQGLARLAAEERPRLLFAYFEGTDTVGHEFAPFSPPRQDGIAARDYERYHGVAEAYFAEIDRDLGELRAVAEANGAVLFIASDHGFRWHADRPRELSSLAAASAARWHRDQGVYLLWGPGVAADRTRGAGSVRQVCATLLALLGLPRGLAVAGPPLAAVPDAPGAARDYDLGFARPRAAAAPPGAVDAEALARLRALGYVGGGEPAGAPAGGSTRTPASFNNEGLLLREAGRTQPAAAAFQQALALDPRYASAAWNLSDLLESEHREPERADTLLLQAAKDGLPDAPERLVARAQARGATGGAAASLRLLDAAVAELPDRAPLWLYRGRYRLEQRDCAGARDDFARAVRLDAHDPLAHASLATAALCLGDAATAKREIEESLRLDPNQPELRRLLGGG